MEDDAVTDVHTSRELGEGLASVGLGTAVSSSWIKAASQASICPPVCLSIFNPCNWTKELPKYGGPGRRNMLVGVSRCTSGEERAQGRRYLTLPGSTLNSLACLATVRPAWAAAA